MYNKSDITIILSNVEILDEDADTNHNQPNNLFFVNLVRSQPQNTDTHTQTTVLLIINFLSTCGSISAALWLMECVFD